MKLWQKLLTSERFWAALASMLIVIGVQAWGWAEPEAQAMATKITTGVVVLASRFIGGKTLRPSTPPPEKV